MLVWNRIDPVDHERLFKLQNRSLVPGSVVYYVQNPVMPVTDTGAHVIVSRQVARVNVPENETLWYAVDKGGICVFSSAPLIKIDNYNIPIVNETITITDTKRTIHVPEGATITMQNLVDTNAGFSMGTTADSTGTGAFILSQYQMFSESFPEDGYVTFNPDITNATSRIVYSITPSATISQLSKATEDMLSDTATSIEMLIRESINKTELDSIIQQMSHGTWSNGSPRILNSVDELPSLKFTASTAFFSEKIAIGDEFDIKVELRITRNIDGHDITEVGSLLVSGVYSSSGTHTALLSTCSNKTIGAMIETVELVVSADMYNISVNVKLNQIVSTASYSTAVKFENAFFDTTVVALTDRTNISNYDVLLVNSDVLSSGDEFANKMMELITTNVDRVAVRGVGDILSVTSSDMTDVNNEVGRETIITTDLSIIKLRRFQSVAHIIHQFNTTEVPQNFEILDSLTMFDMSKMSAITICVRHLKDIVTKVVNGNVVTVSMQLSPIGNRYDYIDRFISSISEYTGVQYTTLVGSVS